MVNLAGRLRRLEALQERANRDGCRSCIRGPLPSFEVVEGDPVPEGLPVCTACGRQPRITAIVYFYPRQAESKG